MDGVRLIDVDGLQAVIDVLLGRGYSVVGPTVRSGSVVNAPITRVDDLPRGWGDEQAAGHYRLRRRGDEALFGFAAGAQSAKPVFFPADEVVWRGARDPDGRRLRTLGPAHPGDPDAPEGGRDASGPGPESPPVALLGVRSCDLCAVGIHDHVLGGRAVTDVHYSARREGAFVVAVACSDPGGTCFCVSMGTGPRPEPGRGAPYDLSLTELLEGRHRFVVEIGSDRGADVLAEAGSSPAGPDDIAAATAVTEDATSRMGRRLDTDGIRDLLYENAESPQWDEIASRCLACTNCTLVCPTCFCTDVEDVSDLAGLADERHRVWDSCFTSGFSYIHGGSVRPSTRSRYRQWMTHKLASWQDQFGTSGCVGCGRCVTWCPAAIDITAEVAAMRGTPGAHLVEERHGDH